MSSSVSGNGPKPGARERGLDYLSVACKDGLSELEIRAAARELTLTSCISSCPRILVEVSKSLESLSLVEKRYNLGFYIDMSEQHGRISVRRYLVQWCNESIEALYS